MPAGRTHVPVNRPIVVATTGPEAGSRNPAAASLAEHNPPLQVATVIPGPRSEPEIAALAADAGGRASSIESPKHYCAYRYRHVSHGVDTYSSLDSTWKPKYAEGYGGYNTEGRSEHG
jgi:hypothetical protein